MKNKLRTKNKRKREKRLSTGEKNKKIHTKDKLREDRKERNSKK